MPDVRATPTEYLGASPHHDVLVPEDKIVKQLEIFDPVRPPLKRMNGNRNHARRLGRRMARNYWRTDPW